MTYYVICCPTCTQIIISKTKNGTCQYCLTSFKIKKEGEFQIFSDPELLRLELNGEATISEYQIFKKIIPICETSPHQVLLELENLSIGPLMKYRIISKLRYEGILIGSLISK